MCGSNLYNILLIIGASTFFNKYDYSLENISNDLIFQIVALFFYIFDDKKSSHIKNNVYCNAFNLPWLSRLHIFKNNLKVFTIIHITNNQIFGATF